MIEPQIKIIKRKDAEAAAIKTVMDKEARQITVVEQNRTRDRAVNATITGWIFAQKEKTRIEQVAAMQETLALNIS